MGPRVLLVDDSSVMRKIIRRLLEEVGVLSTQEAADGVEAMALFNANGFDLVLTDWNMPNMNGLELVQAIRAAGSKVPIIMITTEAEKARIALAINAGASDYMVKPFDKETLSTMLSNRLKDMAAEGGGEWFPQLATQPTAKSSWGKRL
jgi:two-component system chemotaxis response regulator CheY